LSAPKPLHKASVGATRWGRRLRGSAALASASQCPGENHRARCVFAKGLRRERRHVARGQSYRASFSGPFVRFALPLPGDRPPVSRRIWKLPMAAELPVFDHSSDVLDRLEFAERWAGGVATFSPDPLLGRSISEDTPPKRDCEGKARCRLLRKRPGGCVSCGSASEEGSRDALRLRRGHARRADRRKQ